MQYVKALCFLLSARPRVNCWPCTTRLSWRLHTSGIYVRYTRKVHYFFKNIYFIHERHRERGWDTGRGRSRLPAGNPMWDSIPGPWDHSLNRRQMLHDLSHSGAPSIQLLISESWACVHFSLFLCLSLYSCSLFLSNKLTKSLKKKIKRTGETRYQRKMC